MALSAVDCIHRGLFNLRANWELVLIQWLQVLLATLLVLAGAVPPLAVVGWTSPRFFEGLAAAEGALDSWADQLARGGETWLLLLASMAVAAAIWLVAMLVFCYFQGGILGVLMAGDRQAPVGPPEDWRWFRTFSAHDLRGWAARYVWRYFWLLNLFLAFSLLWLLIPLVLAALVTWGEARWGPSAALGIGCGGALPLAFSILILALWLNLAQADLAREESSVWSAARWSLQILGRRLGAVLLIFLIGFVAGLLLTVSAWVLLFFTGLVSGGSRIVGLGGQLTVSLLQWLASSAVGVALISALVGLVRSESLREASP